MARGKVLISDKQAQISDILIFTTPITIHHTRLKERTRTNVYQA